AVPSAAPPAPASPAAFAPPPDSAIPDSPFGQMVRLGERIFTDTGHAAPQYVGNALRCSNCHIDGGRLAGAAPLWAAYVAFPTYRSKNRHVNTFAERLQGCFRFSMNGTAPPLGDKVLVALESYAYFLARGAPTGIEMPGRGFPRLARPAQAPDYARGAAVFAQNCALCHQADGAGQSAGGRVVFPPLWGPHSFNWGAGMTSIANAAAFIKANMPYGKGDSLTDQQAWDVAMFVDSHERPQDPRFAGTIAATRAKFHDTPDSMYGVSLNGVLLGQGDPKSP
ncbi:MAG: c-type cytochrome, partial [Rhodospirillales bacterium]|nr:c-type cytochrome [Rhodospirillales bacterium]